MEQKQLDDMEDSFFGEEFVDEEPSFEDDENKVGSKVKSRNIPRKITPIKKIAAKVSEKSHSMEHDKHKSAHKGESKMDHDKMDKEVEISAVKAPIETKAPVDPWASEKGEESGFFKDASTWKAITGIVVILLILSVLTQGFRFSDKVTGASTGLMLSSADAQGKVLQYVNTNLLRAPFTAKANSVEETENLYKVSLDVAGQSIDSYITKDGKMFFPQGFDTSKTVESQLAAKKQEAGMTPGAQKPGEITTTPTSTDITQTKPSSQAQKSAGTGDVKIIPLQAKKWLFLPNQVTVNKGDIVRLAVTPSTSPSLAMSKFTFSIPDLGVEKEIDGPTIVEFTADKVGRFKFTCSSCESWRGMTGYINVK